MRTEGISVLSGAARTTRPSIAALEGGPRAIGRYVELGTIASGGMGIVSFGRLRGHGGFARRVAIKRLHPHMESEPEFAAMLLDEARIAGRIHHPNVVPTLDVVVEDGQISLIMEYVRGLTVAQIARLVLAKNQRIPPSIAIAILCGVLH